MPDRRGFLGALVGLVAAPFAKWRTRNTLITPEWITRETAARLRGQLAFHRDAFAMVDLPILGVGQTINVRLPERYKVKDA